MTLKILTAFSATVLCTPWVTSAEVIFITKEGIKDCSNAAFPHKRDTIFGYITGKYNEIMEIAKRRTAGIQMADNLG